MVSQLQHTSDLAVEAVGLTKIFKDFWGRPKAKAVNSIDLKIRRGQVFGLLGPNGSGKSTTVKLLLGLLYPSRGSLTVLGESPRNVEIKRRIGYLPEESYLYRYLTAEETLDFFGSLFEIPPAERRRRCRQLLEMVGLEKTRTRTMGEFSKGMARRVGLAQALINDPDLVILDEPTSGLDPIGCREVKDLIKLLASRGKTIILCSHLLADVEDVCDEVVVLYGGQVRARGSLQELLSIQDATRILVPKLEKAVLDRVLTILNEQVGAARVQVDNPTMDLETFFLDVVRRAREASVETSGAQAGGEIAAYLRRRETELGGEALLNQLATGDPEAAAAASPVAVQEPAMNGAKLAALTDQGAPAEASGEADQPADKVPASAAVDTQASERLKSLLDK